MPSVFSLQIQRYRKLRASLIEQLKPPVAQSGARFSYMSTKHKQFKVADVAVKHMKQIVVNEFLIAERVSPIKIRRSLNCVCVRSMPLV
jgi:hypothetical protein